MASIVVEEQIDDAISKFYLESLESLQIRGMGDKFDEFTHFFCDIRDKTENYTQYRAINKLGPILFFIFLKTRGILLVLPEFLDLFEMKYAEFTKDLKKVLRFYPEFKLRDKKFIIKEYIATILKSVGLDEKITSNALNLFEHFYPLIQYTKEEVIAAVICVLTTISFELYEINMKLICAKAGIRQSNLNKYFAEKIFPYLGIPDDTALRTSFDVIKDKIRKKIPLIAIKKKIGEDNIKESPKIDILKRKIGKFRDYRIRYRITQQEVDTACQLRKIGFGHPEIARKINRKLWLTKKIIKENLKDYAKYKYIYPQNRDRNKKLTPRKRIKMEIQAQNLPITPQVAHFYMNYKPVAQLFDSIIEDINTKQSKKVPLDKFSNLLLENKAQIKKNISKTCNYFFKMGIFRAEKTILGLVLSLSFPQISQIQISNLVGFSDLTLRDNLKIKNIEQNFGLVIKEVIKIDLIFSYLERILILIQKNKIPSVKTSLLQGILVKVKQIKATTNKILRVLTEKQLYKREHLILATAIFLSCPLISGYVSSEIISYSLDLKVSNYQILKFQKDISMQKMDIHNQSILFKHLGGLLEERRTGTLCVECGNFIYVQQYQDKKIFVCKHCLERE